MTFAIRNINVLAYGQGFTLWHYRAGQSSLDDVTTAGFFDSAGDMFAIGDMVMISARDGGRIVVVTQTGDAVRTSALS